MDPPLSKSRNSVYADVYISGTIISEIIVPSSLRIVAVIEPKEYCKLKNKFWNALKKSPTSAFVDLQLKLEFQSL